MVEIGLIQISNVDLHCTQPFSHFFRQECDYDEGVEEPDLFQLQYSTYHFLLNSGIVLRNFKSRMARITSTRNRGCHLTRSILMLNNVLGFIYKYMDKKQKKNFPQYSSLKCQATTICQTKRFSKTVHHVVGRQYSTPFRLHRL